MAATQSVDSVWTRKTTRLCRLSSRRPLSSPRCASWLSHDSLLSSSHCAALSSTRRASLLLHRLSSSPHCSALSSSCPASWLSHCLSPSFGCATLLSTRRTSLLSHRLSSSSRCAPRRPLVLLLRRLVVASPLDAPPSCRLVVSLPCLSLPCRASWLSRHHLLPSSRCTALSSSHRAGWLLHCLAATAAIHRHLQTPTPTFVHRPCQILTPTITTHHR